MAKRLRKTVPKERLSPSEWEIMRICWRLGRCTVRDVLAEDLETHKRDYRTILTFMTRMERKGWLSSTRTGRANEFSPTVAQEAALEQETRRFLETVVGEEQRNRNVVRRLLSENKSSTRSRSR